MPILESSCVGLSGKALAYLVSALGLATAGAVDGVNVAFNHESMLAETGLPLEGQLGLAVIFLTGFVIVANKFLDSQNEKFKILQDHIAKLEEEKKTLVARLTLLNDETRKQLEQERASHDK